jgi:hypothetical protein
MKKKIADRLRVDVPRISSELVFSPSEMTPDYTNFIIATERAALRLYDELCDRFYKEGVSYTRQVLLKSTAEEWQIHLMLNFNETYKIVNIVANTLMMNEYEILYWSLFLRTMEESLKPSLYAYFTAFLSKLNLNSDVKPFEICLNSIIPNFRVHFNNWQLVSELPTEITSRDLNTRYRQLNDICSKGVKNYENMVQQLMQIPRRKESLAFDEVISDIDTDNINGSSLEDFELDLVQEAKHSPIDKREV